MKEFKGIIKKKGISKTIVYSVLALVMLIPVIILHQPVGNVFKGTCHASNFKQLQKCQKQGRYTKVTTLNVYDAGYSYMVDGEVVGKFLDIDLDGNVILTLADVNVADELLAEKGLKTIEGRFSTFDNKVFQETLEKVQADYIKRWTNDADNPLTEEQTKNMFFSYLLNQYDGIGFPYVLIVMIVGIVLILLSSKIIGGVKMILKPEKTIVHGKKTLEHDEDADKASFEYYRGPYLFKNKNIYITNNYIFDNRGYSFRYHKINEAVWVYEKGNRLYGIFETGKQLVIKFKDRAVFTLPLTLPERKKVMEILRVKNPNIVRGYDQIAQEQYKKNPATMK